MNQVAEHLTEELPRLGSHRRIEMEVVDDDHEDAAGSVAARTIRRENEAVAGWRWRRQHVDLPPAMDHRQRDDVLLDAVLEDLELAGLEVGDELSAGVADDDIGADQIDAGGKRGRPVLSRDRL